MPSDTNLSTGASSGPEKSNRIIGWNPTVDSGLGELRLGVGSRGDDGPATLIPNVALFTEHSSANLPGASRCYAPNWYATAKAIGRVIEESKKEDTGQSMALFPFSEKFVSALASVVDPETHYHNVIPSIRDRTLYKSTDRSVASKSSGGRDCIRVTPSGRSDCRSLIMTAPPQTDHDWYLLIGCLRRLPELEGDRIERGTVPGGLSIELANHDPAGPFELPKQDISIALPDPMIRHIDQGGISFSPEGYFAGKSHPGDESRLTYAADSSDAQ